VSVKLATVFTVTAYGCAEYLQRTGRADIGELEVRGVGASVPSIEDVQRVVANYYKLPQLEMKSARRDREVARPRQIAMYLSRELTPRSLPQIGRRFGDRDHTTVLHAIRRIEQLFRTDVELARDIGILRRELGVRRKEIRPCPQL